MGLCCPAEAADARLVAVILPPNEGFSPESVGAIGLMAQRLGASGAAAFRTVVIGATLRHKPFAVPCFEAVHPPAWLPASRTMRYVWGVSRRLRQLRPSLIEVHNRPAVALALARRFPGVPTVLVLHNDPQAMRGAATAAGRGRLRRLARVVAVSPYVSGRLTEGVADWRPPPVVQPNCIDLSAMPPPVPQDRRDRVIVFAGRLVPEKGADRLVAACARALPGLPGWRAEVIGARRLRPDGAGDAYSATLARAAAAAGVTMAGHLPHAEVLAAMARAALVVVPSRWPEPFGLTALEAMASGAALICSPRGNLPELVQGAAVLVDPDDAGGLADAITVLARDEPRRAALGAAGLERARAFDIGVGTAALDRLRREILGA
jgi:UDP-glucose:(glucosyl)LPS alpha-1,2-glucosyltransferase